MKDLEAKQLKAKAIEKIQSFDIKAIEMITEIYTHVSTKSIQNIISPFDTL